MNRAGRTSGAEVLYGLRLPGGFKQVLQVHDADHVVEVALIGGQARVDGLGGLVQHGLHGPGEIDRHHIEAGNHHIGHAQIPELCPALHQPPLNILQNARLVTLHNEQLQFFDGIRPLAFLGWRQPQQAQEAIPERIHAPDHRRKHPDGQLHRLGDEEGDTVRVAERDGFGDELAQHDEQVGDDEEGQPGGQRRAGVGSQQRRGKEDCSHGVNEGG